MYALLFFFLRKIVILIIYYSNFVCDLDAAVAKAVENRENIWCLCEEKLDF